MNEMQKLIHPVRLKDEDYTHYWRRRKIANQFIKNMLRGRYSYTCEPKLVRNLTNLYAPPVYKRLPYRKNKDKFFMYEEVEG